MSNADKFNQQISGAIIRPAYIKVLSASKAGEWHFVSRGRAGHLRCDCYDFTRSNPAGYQCRHILAALIAAGRAALRIEGEGDALRLVLEAALADTARLRDGYLFADYRSAQPCASACRSGYSPRNYNPPATVALTCEPSRLESEGLPVALRAALIEADGGDVLASLRPKRARRAA